jgi:hypothetical protein
MGKYENAVNVEMSTYYQETSSIFTSSHSHISLKY